MNTYMIRRRNNWNTAEDLERTAALSKQIGDEEMADRVRWIRSYVVEEDDGTLGTLCIYQGRDEAAIREHAERAGMTADEIKPLPQTVVVRPDPQTC